MPGLKNQLESHSAHVFYSQGFKNLALVAMVSRLLQWRWGWEIGQAGRLDTPTAPVLPEQTVTSADAPTAHVDHKPPGHHALHGFSHLHLDLARLRNRGSLSLLVPLCGTCGLVSVSSDTTPLPEQLLG